jgi:hypothetical protein
MADSIKDDGSIYSRATSTCPLLPADGDVASVTSANTSQPTAGKAVLTAFDPPVGILEGYTTREETVLEYEEAKSSVTGCVVSAACLPLQTKGLSVIDMGLFLCLLCESAVMMS